MESTGYNVDKERAKTIQLLKDTKAKLQDLEKFVQSTHSVDPLYYISLNGDIKRLIMSIEHLKDLAVEYKDNTGERL
jgi:hypothetical protein